MSRRMECGGRGGWIRALGLILMLVGALVLLISLPARLWVCLLGAGLIALGFVLRRTA